jgi:hypothetical protein
MTQRTQRHVDLERKLAAGQKSFVAYDLSGLDLSRLDLSDADFRDCSFEMSQLSNVDFSKSDLTRADFTGAWLEDANFTDAHVPYQSRDVISEILRQAAETLSDRYLKYRRLAIAGVVVIARGDCWEDLLRQQNAFHHADVVWALRTLQQWPVLADRLRWIDHTLLPREIVDAWQVKEEGTNDPAEIELPF